MSTHLIAWGQFIACVALLGVAGTHLIRYGDAIASLTGLSRGWVGLVLVATVTSLPELVTGVSAVAVARAPDLAVGDALGSTVFNLALLAFAAGARRAPYRGAAADREARRGLELPAAFGVILLAAAALVLALAQHGATFQVGHLDAGSMVIVVLYLVAMRAFYQRERQTEACAPAMPGLQGPVPAMTLRAALTGYALASLVILGSGIWLPVIAVDLARLMGWSDSFVGAWLVALATSLPEVATTWGALRLGLPEMAIANLLGSNLFDVLILAIDDLAYLPGSLYAQVSPMHVVSALVACLMTASLLIPQDSSPSGSPSSSPSSWHMGRGRQALLVGLYLLNIALLYFYSA